ncbi:hypothetical protein WA026_012113 [Henosepilachna vigintioctopunctata]|uniref:Uncharacterized protein n=1 Tax=Henosepilachna vigintioctopunctata TaxID=420089 RepID=A0AAW1V6M6_9CUCU
MLSIEDVNSLDVFNPSTEFKSLGLSKFCVKKHFEIGLVNTLTPEDEPFLNKLISLNKIKEDITHVTFIDSSDVMNFIKTSAGSKDSVFPPFLLEELKNFSKYHENPHLDSFALINQACSIKFKLIQAMYEQFSNEVREKRRQELLGKELAALADKRPIGSREKRSRSNMGSRSKHSTATSKKKSIHEIDCTEIGLTENDLIVDDILKDQVYFYIIKGYNDIKLVKELAKMHVEISFIIQISERTPHDQNSLKQFWKDIDTVRSYPCDFLKNIALMKYQPPPHDCIVRSPESNLKDIVDIVKSLIDLKRLHFNYVKDLLLIDTKLPEIFNVFPLYESLMDRYPPETLTIPLIIDGMLEELQFKSIKNAVYTKKLTRPHPRKKNSCPFDIFSKVRRPNGIKKVNDATYFKVYENDNLNLTFNSYKVGSEYMKSSLRVLKLQVPVQLAQRCEFNTSIDDYLPHAHEVCIPSVNQAVLTNDQTDHLINLLYLKNSILRKSTPVDMDGNEFTRNLIIHNSRKFVEDALPKYVSEKTGKFSETFIGMNREFNVYQSIRPLSLHWGEVLKPELLLQYLLDSQLKYLCSDYVVCDLTNTLMVRFHNDVDTFGLHTTVWKEYLRSPVGLADFCKFVLMEDYEWLKKHIPYSQITYVDIVRRLEKQTPVRLADDVSNNAYKHLLTPEIQYSSSDIRKYNQCACFEDDVSNSSKDERGLYSQRALSSNLHEILHDLDEYTKTVDFADHCRREPSQPFSFPAYGMGSTKFNITGHTTTFISMDNVILTVDTSRLCTEISNLNLKLLSDDNLFVLHTNQKNFNFHFILADGTIVVFAKPKEEECSGKTDTNSSPYPSTKNLIYDELSAASRPSATSRQEQEQEEQMIISMDFNHYSSLELYPVVGNIIRESPEELYRKDVEKEMDILQRLQTNTNCIKVARRGSFEHLEQIVTENAIPISSVVRRIINNPEKDRLCSMPKRKCVILGDVPPKKLNSSFDYAITVPNGLTVKVLPSENTPNSYIVKQSYQYAVGPENVEEEKYRIFTNDGNIIIRKVDGTMRILTSSGKEVRFDKISNTSGEEVHCKSHKKLDEDLVRKLLTRLMSNHPDQEESDFYPSRRAHLRSKSKSVSNCPKLIEMSKIPFSAISVVTLDGNRITLKDKKLSKISYSRLMSEINFLTEERQLKREDGFTSTTDRDGSHHVYFPDGTSIRTTVFIEDEIVRVNEKDKMGWVVITTVFSYEHAFYKPVYFDNVNDNIKIRLNEHQSLEVTEKGARLDMKNSAWDIKTDVISFTKTCERCDSHYNCEICIEPLYQNKKLDQEANFVTAKDSYDKTFKADYSGNCKVIPSTIKGAFNKNGCNHAVMTDHQKIYCIKKDLSGMLLWNDRKMTSLIRSTRENQTVHHNIDSKNTLLLVTITKNMSTKFSERFLGKVIREFEMIEEMLPVNRPVLYQVTRKLYSLIEVGQIDDLVKCLQNVFKEEEEQELSESKSVVEFLQHYTDRSRSSLISASEEESKTPLATISVHEKIMALGKQFREAKKIMQAPLPNYFHSSLCTYVPP